MFIDKLKLKKIMLINSLSLSLLLAYRFSQFRRYNFNIKINNEYNNDYNTFFASYENGNVYICKNSCQLKYLKKNINENDVIIIDYRNKEDLDYQVYHSYLIYDKESQNEIIMIIQSYDDICDSSWDRSIESMRNEWAIHNILYSFGISKERTNSVDFNNEDEEVYNSYILTKILGN